MRQLMAYAGLLLVACISYVFLTAMETGLSFTQVLFGTMFLHWAGLTYRLPRHGDNGQWARFTLVLLILPVLYLFYLSVPAQGHEWYTGLRAPDTGIPCCDVRDCAPAEMCVDDSGKEGLLISGACVPIDWTKVLNMISPDGEAHACVVTGQVRCIILPGAA